MKNTVITGSSRGIGKAVAEEFAKNGYHVVINASKSADELEETRKEFVNKGYSCSAVLADVSDYGQCQRLFEAEPDVLINNAGISHIGLFTDMTPAEWKRLIDINLLSAFNCSHIALKSMIRNHRGRIINISSIWGERGASCEVVYSASKGGINSFTKALAKEVYQEGVRVHMISPGSVYTDMIRIARPDLSPEGMILPEEIAELAAFLLEHRGNGIIDEIQLHRTGKEPFLS